MTDDETIDAQAAFDELGHLVLGEQSMDELLRRIAHLALSVVDAADHVSITLVRDNAPKTVVSTSQLAVTLDQAQYAGNGGPCVTAATTGLTERVDDMRDSSRWPEFTQAAADHGILSSLSTPIPRQQLSRAALNMYAADAQAFDDDAVQLAASFAGYAGVALANLHLYESTRVLADQLQNALDSRAVIEQAKGVLMAQHHCSADQAFDMLVRLSQQSNRKLREIAQALVESALLD